MKRILLLSLLMLPLFTLLTAQNSNLVFFTENGEQFSVVLNGILQNRKPETNIKITDLPAPSYKLKVLFADKNLGEIDKVIYPKRGFETSFSVRKNKNNEYVIRYLNDVALNLAPAQPEIQEAVIYHAEPFSTTSTVTTTAVNTSLPAGTSAGVAINDPNSGGSLSLNLNSGGSSSQVTTTTTTTTTSGNTELNREPDQPGIHPQDEEPGERPRGHEKSRTDKYPGQERHGKKNNRNGHEKDEKPYDSDSQHPGSNNVPDHYVLKGYHGKYGCAYPISPADFEAAKKSINSKSFEDSKLTIARQIIGSNCLLSSQVREIMLVFSFETTRLDIAKFAYGHTLDSGNYYKVNDAFTFETSIEELNNYITNGK